MIEIVKIESAYPHLEIYINFSEISAIVMDLKEKPDLKYMIYLKSQVGYAITEKFYNKIIRELQLK